jgi:trehalose 6-phosphate phosphatase
LPQQSYRQVPAFDAFPPPQSLDLSSIALLLDVDGTILDMASTPKGVVVPESLRRSLERLHTKCGGAVAFVSGRLIANIDRLFAPLRLPAIGAHGAEIRLSSNGSTHSRHAELIAQECRQQVAAVASADQRIIVENKGASVAIHYRLAPELEKPLRSRIATIVEQAGDLELLEGKAVIEVKSRRFSKGTAVRELMTNPPFADRKPVFIGDDITDESVFAALPAYDGIGYSVERFMTGACGMFGSPAEVREWLAMLDADE